MGVIWFFGSLFVIFLIGYGSWKLTKYAAERYGYNIFNAVNLILLFIMLVTWGGLFVGEAMSSDNLIVCSIASVLVLLGIFIRNWKNTSLFVAIGSSILQIMAVLTIFIAVIMFLFKNRKTT